MFRKQIAIVVAAVLSLNLMTACAGNGQQTESATGNTEAVAQAEVVEEEDAEPQVAPVPEGQVEEAQAGAGQTGTTQQAGTGKTAADQAGTGSTATTGSTQQAGAATTATTGTTQSGTGTTQQAGAATTGTTQQPGTGSTATTGTTQQPSEPAAETQKPAPHTVMGRQESNANVILPGFTYTLEAAQAVEGRQGVAYDNGEYWVSGSDVLARYDKDWKPAAENKEPFKDLEVKADRLGDIDFYNGELYVCAETVNGKTAKDAQILVYNAQTLKPVRAYAISAASGQQDCSGVAVDPDTQSIWTCSRSGQDSGRYLYRYSLETGAYIGKIHMQAAPQSLRGLAYYNGYLYMTADDGTADMGEPDHIYRWRVDSDSTDATVTLERTLDDVTAVGEVGGLSFDKKAKKLLVLSNYGAQIADGEITGLYEGFEQEAHEVHTFSMVRNDWPMDYSLDELWISRPDAEAAVAAKADVFVVLPTVNMNMWVPDNEDVTSLRDALRFVKTLNMEKGIFGAGTAIYSPYYRQWTLGVATLAEGAEKERYREIARDDIRAAFSWYLDNIHQEGRPIVLFGFSQGAEDVYDLMVEYGQDARLADNLVAAYVIGHGITQADITASPWLKMAQGETDTGVIISYECMDRTAVLPETKVLSINPLNWKTDSTEAPASANKGYVATDTYGNVRQEIPGFCGGYLDEKSGILIPIGIADAAKYAAKDITVVPDGSYHFYDLIFFYNNLKENVGKRIKAFEDAKAAPQPENAGGQATMVPDAKPETNTNEQPGAEKEPGADTAPKADEEIGEGVL